MIVLDLEGLIYRFLDSLPNYYFMSEGADEARNASDWTLVGVVLNYETLIKIFPTNINI